MICQHCKQDKEVHMFPPRAVRLKPYQRYCSKCTSEMLGHTPGHCERAGTRKLKFIERLVNHKQSLKETARRAEREALIEARRKRLEGNTQEAANA